MATVTKVIALTLRPSIVVQFTHPLKVLLRKLQELHLYLQLTLFV